VNSLEAGLVNEKSEIVIKGEHITLKMIQIAGFLARRVITHVKPDDLVKRGQVIGLINLGSQVTLIVPDAIQINIKKGDRVVAGETILAKINS
jgi:phosphatidylserine decarboxylase